MYEQEVEKKVERLRKMNLSGPELAALKMVFLSDKERNANFDSGPSVVAEVMSYRLFFIKAHGALSRMPDNENYLTKLSENARKVITTPAYHKLVLEQIGKIQHTRKITTLFANPVQFRREFEEGNVLDKFKGMLPDYTDEEKLAAIHNIAVRITVTRMLSPLIRSKIVAMVKGPTTFDSNAALTIRDGYYWPVWKFLAEKDLVK
ncbi:MAG: hypothetical protein ABIG96_00805 [Candidatus Micrarchaeota archaeon]